MLLWHAQGSGAAQNKSNIWGLGLGLGLNIMYLSVLLQGCAGARALLVHAWQLWCVDTPGNCGQQGGRV